MNLENLPSYHNQNEYSYVSAVMMTHRLRSSQARKVLSTLLRSPEGEIAENLELLTGLAGNSLRPRLLGLERLGLVERNGQSRLSRSGRPCEVWVIANAAT